LKGLGSVVEVDPEPIGPDSSALGIKGAPHETQKALPDLIAAPQLTH
jgi:hypothetical protein